MHTVYWYIIYGRNISQIIWREAVVSFPTSPRPNWRFCTTWRHNKVNFAPPSHACMLCRPCMMQLTVHAGMLEKAWIWDVSRFYTINLWCRYNVTATAMQESTRLIDECRTVASDNPQNTQSDLSRDSTRKLLSSTLAVAIYYSAWMLIVIYRPTEGWRLIRPRQCSKGVAVSS